MLTPKHIKARLIWVKRMMNQDFGPVCSMQSVHFYPPPSSTQVRFSDEKRFSVWNDGPVRVWRRQADRCRQGFTKGTVKHSKGIMMHLIIASDGTSVLTKCDDRQDSGSYQRMVLTPNLHWIRRRSTTARRANPIIFQHDGAPSHTSNSTRAFLRVQRVTVLPDWPPNSPDLNPVEHCWAWISKQLVGQQFRNAGELETAIRAVWAARDPRFIPNLYGSMVRRLTAVLVAKGASTRY